MSARAAARLAWFLWALAMTLTGPGLLFLFQTRSTPIPESWGFRGFEAIFAITFSTVGTLIASRHPRNPIGWILCAVSVDSGLQLLAKEYVFYTMLVRPGSLPGGEAVAWFQSWLWILAVGPIGTFVFMWFPNGQLVSPRWRLLPWLSGFAIALALVGFAFRPGPLQNFQALNNPLGIEGGGLQLILALGFLLLFTAMFLAVVSLVLRFRRAKHEERQQLKWFAYAAAPVPVAISISSALSFLEVTGIVAEVFELLGILFFSGVVVAVGIAILKYRLYDIDLIINRTLVYGSLTAILAGVYTASIGLFQRLFVAVTGEESDAAIVLTTLVVAAAFTPVRANLQTVVDKRFKEVRDPTKELRAFGEQVKSVVGVMDVQRITRRLLDEAAQAFEAKSGAIYYGQDEQMQPIHTFGDWSGEARLSLPLESDGVRYGFIALGPRRNGLDYTAQDQETLQQIAGLVAQAIKLAERDW